MPSILVRLLNALRRKPRAEAPKLDPEKAEIGLELSNLDGDDHTTQALSDELGIETRAPAERRDAA
jgi:hypothetical protein